MEHYNAMKNLILIILVIGQFACGGGNTKTKTKTVELISKSAFSTVDPEAAGSGFIKVKVSNIDCSFYEYANMPSINAYTWRGRCRDGLLQGDGILEFHWKDDNGREGINSLKGRYVGGLQVGEWKTYDEEGNFLIATFFVEGKENGERRQYSRDGILIVSPFVNGKSHGERKVYNKDGSLRWVVPFVNGRKHGEAKAYKNEAIRKVITCVNGEIHGQSKQYYKNGTLKSITPYVHGKIHGDMTGYDKNGTLVYTIPFTDGRSGCIIWAKDESVTCPKNDRAEPIDGDCLVGTESCPCIVDEICNSGFTCVLDTCVRAP